MPHDPSTGHYDVALTNVSLRLKPYGLVGDRLSPICPVNKQTGYIREYDKSHLRAHNTLIGRGGRAEAPSFEWGLASDVSFKTVPRGIRDAILDDEVDNWDSPLDAQADTVESLTDVMLLDREIRLAAILLSTSYLTKYTTLSGTSQWSDHTNGISDPIGDVKTGIVSCRDNGGMTPNTIAMDWETALNFCTHPDVVGLTKYSGEITKQRMLAILRALFDLEPVIAGAMYNSATQGQTATLAPVWGTDVLIGYIEPRPRLKCATLGFTCSWKPGRSVKKWAVPDPDATNVRVKERGIIEKVSTAGLGYLIKAAIA